jgi:Zn-dependent peptidase ImmA (M78 family)
VRLGRHLRGLSQKEAAEKLGLSQAILSRLENDLIECDDVTLQKASVGYSLPKEFFDFEYTVYGPPVSVHAMLRGKADVSAREVDMITAELNIRLFHLSRFLENVDYRPTADLPCLDIEQFDSPERVAALLRAHWKVPSGIVKNLTRLMERAGIIIGLSDFNGSSVSGVTFKAPGHPPIILLNKMHPADRLRFTLAHELGHLVMHRFPTANMEDEANKFASAFLLPPDELRQMLRGRKITLELLAALKKECLMSMQAILMAAQAIGCILPNQARYLWQQMSSRGWRLREPAELDFEFDQPAVLPAILRSHVQDLGYSVADLVRFSRLHDADFSNFYGKLDQGDPGPKPRLRIVN